MAEVISMFLIGLVMIFIGISNMKGNISSLHSYHRKRITEKDKPIVGKKVGVGTILCGFAISSNAIFRLLEILTKMKIFDTLCGVSLLMGLVGIGIVLFTINKYNKGLF